MEWQRAVVQLLDLIRVMNGQHSLPVVAKGREIKEKEDIRVSLKEGRSTRKRGTERRTGRNMTEV